MDIHIFTHAELHDALSALFYGVQLSAIQINNILTNTEKFDIELSVRVIEHLSAVLESGNQLLIDSYHRQGLTDEQIEQRIKFMKDVGDDGDP
jgi:hypothetical protein